MKKPLAPPRLSLLDTGLLAMRQAGRRWPAPLRLAALCVAVISGCGANNDDLFPALVLPASSDPPPADVPGVLPGQPDAPPPSEDPTPEDPVEVPGVDLPLNGPLPFPARPREPGEPPPAPPPAKPSGPVVVSVSPADGARGVRNDASIVLTFSEPMDRASTQAAYQSEVIPSGSVSFEWSEGDTVLSIVPSSPPAYASGPDVELVEARRVAFFLSASASSQSGSPLAQPYEFSYSLLRQVQLSVFAVQDRDLSGSFRSNDTYGAGQCARDEVNMCVGDVRVSGSNQQTRGFISFELSDLPEDISGLSAELTLEITDMSGNPFGNLGGLVLEHLSFEAIGADAFEADAVEEIGLIASDGEEGSSINADVSSALLAGGGSALTQYRLRFEDATDGDNNSDAIVSDWDTQRLDVSYLTP